MVKKKYLCVSELALTLNRQLKTTVKGISEYTEGAERMFL